MNTRMMEDLKETLCESLEEIANKGDISRSDLESVHKLTDTIKNIDKITMIEESGYSYEGEDPSEGSYRRGRSYDGEGESYDGSMNRSYGRSYAGRSYAGRRGKHYVRGHYSYDGSDEMVTQRLEEMMNAGNLNAMEKETLKKAMQILGK